jgi:hypothetical protein
MATAEACGSGGGGRELVDAGGCRGSNRGPAGGQQRTSADAGRPGARGHTAMPGQAGQAKAGQAMAGQALGKPRQAGHRTEVAAMRFSVKGVKSRMMWCTVICRWKGRKEGETRGSGRQGAQGCEGEGPCGAAVILAPSASAHLPSWCTAQPHAAKRPAAAPAPAPAPDCSVAADLAGICCGQDWDDGHNLSGHLSTAAAECIHVWQPVQAVGLAVRRRHCCECQRHSSPRAHRHQPNPAARMGSGGCWHARFRDAKRSACYRGS